MATRDFKNVPSTQISDQTAWDHIQTESVLIPAPLMNNQRFMQLLDDVIVITAKTALSELGGVALIVRDLSALDIGGSNRHWNQQVAVTNNSWVTSTFSAGTVTDNVFVAILGIAALSPQGGASGIRIDVGGARVAEWDLQKMLMPYGVEGSAMDTGRYGFARSAVLAGQNKQVTLTYYVRAATNIDNVPVENPLIGIAVEPVGGGNAGLVP